MITIELDATTVPAGAVLRGRVRAEAGTGQRPRGLVLEVGWRTEGRGNRDRGVVHTERRAAVSDPAAWDEAFEAAIPAEGPISYDGQLVRILWEVKASLDTPWAADEAAVQPFEVTVGP